MAKKTDKGYFVDSSKYQKNDYDNKSNKLDLSLVIQINFVQKGDQFVCYK